MKRLGIVLFLFLLFGLSLVGCQEPAPVYYYYSPCAQPCAPSCSPCAPCAPVYSPSCSPCSTYAPPITPNPMTNAPQSNVSPAQNYQGK